MNKIITIGRQFASEGSEIAKKLSELTGIPCYDSETEMLDAHPEIEAVVLASENSEHLRQVRLCAERKINILSMKIPSFDMDEYREYCCAQNHKCKQYKGNT